MAHKVTLRRGSAQVRIVLLIGHGSRVPAIVECVKNIPSAKIVYVLSCVGEGMGTDTARENGIGSGILRLRDFGKEPDSRARFSRVMTGMLIGRKVDLIIMAGWMVIMPSSFVREFQGRIINIHPSILPAYPGKAENVIPAQWNDKAAPAGCTLHYVDEGVDSGKHILKGYVVKKAEDYSKFSSLEEFEAAIHAKEDEVLCSGIKKIIRKLQSAK